MARLLKLLVIVAGIGLLVYLFVQSAASTRAEPYAVEQSSLRGWTLGTNATGLPANVLLALQPPRELGARLFREVFTRAAESFNGPTVPFVPLLLADEYQRALAGQATLEEVRALAQEAGVASGDVQPVCMAYRRESAPGVTRQLYFVRFKAPAVVAFRQQVAARAAPGSGFDPDALSPAMIVAASDPDFVRWLPLGGGEADCIAPVVATE